MKDRLRNLSRRDLFGILGGTAVASLLSACGGRSEPTPKPVVKTTAPVAPLTPVPVLETSSSVPATGIRWIDTQLAQANDPILKSIEFYFDGSYQKGSLAMEICFNSSSGEYRIISRQESLNGPGPGYLFNRPYDIDKPCVIRYPVIEVLADEVDKVNIGSRRFDQPYDSTYTGRSYKITRVGSSHNIGVQALGIATLNPESIQPRDPATAKDYFKR